MVLVLGPNLDFLALIACLVRLNLEEGVECHHQSQPGASAIQWAAQDPGSIQSPL